VITKNYTGAEIEAVCRSATSFAIFKVDSQTPGAPSSVASGMKVDKKKQQGFVEHQVFMRDFEKALEEIKPAFGMDNSGLENKLVGGFIDYGKNF
jgi:vesicle-fusing ATPase